MDIMNYYILAIKKYFDFSTRSTRKEYWFFVLFNIIISTIVGLIDSIIGISPILSSAYYLFVFIPGLSVAIRRLHDIGKSGWWIFINLIPFIGFIWFIILLVLDSQPIDNKYGPNPKSAIQSPQV